MAAGSAVSSSMVIAQLPFKAAGAHIGQPVRRQEESGACHGDQGRKASLRLRLSDGMSATVAVPSFRNAKVHPHFSFIDMWSFLHSAARFVCRRRHVLLPVRRLVCPSERGSNGSPSAGKTIPAPSKARSMAATVRGCGFLTPFSNSLIVASLRLHLAPSRTRDQFNSALAIRDCSAVRFRTSWTSCRRTADRAEGSRSIQRALTERKRLSACRRGPIVVCSAVLLIGRRLDPRDQV